MGTRAVVRTAFILIFTALCVVANGIDLALPWHPFSTYGISGLPNGYIAAADSAAQRSGIHAGDHADVAKMTPRARQMLLSFFSARPGSTMTIPLTSGRTVTLQAHLYVRSLVDNVSDIFAVLALCAFIVVAAALVLLRPTAVTWAFYVFAFGMSLDSTLFGQVFGAQTAIAFGLLVATARPLSAAAFLSFALRFPDSNLRGPALALERTCIGAAFAAAAGNVVSSTLFRLYGTQAPFIHAYGTLLWNGLFAAGTVVLLLRYAAADAERKNRLQWVVAAFSVAFIPLLVIAFMENGLGLFPEVTYINIAQIFILVAPVALAYTILKHRLFDIRFIVSRAVVYAVLTSLTVGLLALVDWGFGRWLAESRFALVAELGLAVVIGITLTSAHRRIEAFLNSVIFRAQMAALAALRRFAQETDLIDDPRDLLRQTYEAVRIRVECEYAAIYTAQGAEYALASAGADGVPAQIAASDFAVLRLRRWHEPFECDEPGHVLRGALLLPMTARGRLIGFVVCGPKRDRTHYLPEEVETLSLLTHRTGSAFALLTLSGAPA